VKGLGGEASDALSKLRRSTRRVSPSSMQLMPRRPLKARPLVLLVFRVYELCHVLIIFWTSVQTNSTRCVLKRVLIKF
jgi:hypothetical protein